MTTSSPVRNVGENAPDVTLADGSGEAVRLADLWQQRPLLIVFLRHYG